MSGPHTASGISLTVPGFASRSGPPYGDHWLVRLPNGRRVLALHSDYGPAVWTGRVIDLTTSLLNAGGYPGCSPVYPTDAIVRAVRVAWQHYPSCSFAAGVAVRQLHRIQHRHGRQCLTGPEVRRMRRFQRRHGFDWSARTRTLTWGTWRALFHAN